MKTISRSLTLLGIALRAFETQSFSFGAGNRTQEKGPRDNKSFTQTFKAFSRIASAAVLTLCSTLALAQAFFADDASPANETTPHRVLLVDDDHIECPGAGYTTIQAAVNAAAPGDTVQVCPGTYDEQVEIAKRLTLEGVERNGEKAAVVQPSNMIDNTNRFYPVAVAILVHDTSDVTIRNITVDGINNGVGCQQPPVGTDPFLDGISYETASGKIESVVVRNMLTPQGCAEAAAIDFQSQTSAQLTVRDSSVHDYDEIGILANGPGVNLHAIRNTITGLGPREDMPHAQVGIQIGFGGKGLIEENTVTNHIFALCASISECGANAIGILVFSTTQDVKIARNVVGKSQVGIFVVFASNADVLENTVLDTDVFDGIAVFGDNNTVKGNVITNSDESAVFIEGTNNLVRNNTINETPVGLLVTAGNNFWSNQFFNTSVLQEVLAAGAPSESSRAARRQNVIASSIMRRPSR